MAFDMHAESTRTCCPLAVSILSFRVSFFLFFFFLVILFLQPWRTDSFHTNDFRMHRYVLYFKLRRLLYLTEARYAVCRSAKSHSSSLFFSFIAPYGFTFLHLK